MNAQKKSLYACRLVAAVAAVLASSWTLQSQGQMAPPPPPLPAGEQPEVLTRGPVHEAFAEPVVLEHQVGMMAPIQPPANIDEVPPADRPAGDEFVWVPGYWSWDGDRNGYIWVTACWRAMPPNMAWVPGYWSRAATGWEWVPGFWTPAGALEIEYLPAPPANEDVEAPGPPPLVDNSWVPPCWYWSEGRYIQRSGYWLAAQPGWVWVASHYLWTPRGYVFAGGHWDYPLEDRGVLFAPVYIPPTAYARVGYAYSPSVVIDVEFLSASLFVSPRYSHYYYGDYYDDAYLQVGIYPWFDRDRIPDYYDPIYNYDRASTSRSQPNWNQQVQHDYDVRRTDTALRPPRTYHEMETRIALAPEPQRRSLQVVEPLSVVVDNSTNITNITNITTNQITNQGVQGTVAPARLAAPVRFEKVTPAAQTRIAAQAADVKKLGNDRKNWEASAAIPKSVSTPNVLVAPVAPGAARGAVPPTERKPPAGAGQNVPMPLAPPAARNEPVNPPTPVLPPAGRNPAVIPAAPKEPVVIPTPERKPPATATPTPIAPLPEPVVRTTPVVSPAGRRTAAAPPREVPVAQPERVKLSVPPVADVRPTPAADRGPPPKPVSEVKASPEPKAPPDPKGPPKKDDVPTSRPNDPAAPGGRGSGRGN